MTFSGKDVTAFFIIGALVGCWFGYGFAQGLMQSRAIKEECAHYDTKTAEFKWGP